MKLILVFIWLIVTGALFVRAHRKARQEGKLPRGMAAWRPMAKALFHAALISGLIVYVGGSVALFLLNQQMMTGR